MVSDITMVSFWWMWSIFDIARRSEVAGAAVLTDRLNDR